MVIGLIHSKYWPTVYNLSEKGKQLKCAPHKLLYRFHYLFIDDSYIWYANSRVSFMFKISLLAFCLL